MLKPKLSARLLLVLVGSSSLTLTVLLNYWAGRELPPAAGWVADAALPSCLGILGVAFALRTTRALGWSAAATPWRSVLRISGLWLGGWLSVSLPYACSKGSWVAYAHTAPRLAAFLVFGPLGEEILFRGCVFEQTERAFPASRVAPVWISSLLFSAHHFSLNHYLLTSFAISQMAFTLPMGLIFARLRQWSGSLWPSLALHVLTNLPGAFGS